MDETFVGAISGWIDADGLVGTCFAPKKWSGGNQLEETALACAIELALHGKDADQAFLQARSNAIGGCRNNDGSFSKNPGRPDQITHDDLLPVSAVSKLCGFPWASSIATWGFRSGWCLSNTGQSYWDAEAKPSQIAAYKICSGFTPAWYEAVSNVAGIFFGTKYGSPSNDRIAWLLGLALQGCGPITDMAFAFWRSAAKKRYGSVGGMMLQFYGWEQRGHPFVQYGDMIAF